MLFICRSSRPKLGLVTTLENFRPTLKMMTKVAGNYNYTLTLLVMPEAERRWRRRDEDEEPVEDSYDRFRAGGRVR